MSYTKPSLLIMQCKELHTYVSLVTYLSTYRCVILHLCGGTLITVCGYSLAMYMMPQAVTNYIWW